jgi:hypothetical protein
MNYYLIEGDFDSLKRKQSLKNQNNDDEEIDTLDPNELSQTMLSQLKYKTMIMVLSLMEMQQSKSVIKRIFRQLPMSLLKKNLATLYLRYSLQYGDSY